MIIDTQIVKLNTARFFSQISDSVLGIPFSNMKRTKQKTVAHCGPAAVEMLLSYVGKKVGQDRLVSKTGSTRKWFELYGTNPRGLARSVDKLFPTLEFWYKKGSSLRDVSRAINEFKYPVGIEWQGIFEYAETVDYDPSYGVEDDDPGHYGVVTAIDTKRNFMRIADPERHYAGHDRKFEISVFKKRWWDTNDFKVKGSKKTRKVIDNKMMFVIVPKGEAFPKKLGMIKVSD